MAAAGLLVAGVVAPVEARDWFGPLEGLAPAEPARAAAGTVVAGTPEDCSTVDPDPDDSSTTWVVEDGADADDRECVLTAEAVCPTGQVKPGGDGTPPYLCYPQSCAGTAFNVDQIGDYWVPRPGVDTSSVTNECLLFQLTECSAGIGPTHQGRCRYVKRRSWTCPGGHSQHNRFNTCYMNHPASAPGTPPPCDTATGAPTLTLVSCADYADDDYDNSQDCDADISSSHLTDRSGGNAAAYWCEFDASQLNVDCHRATTPSGADCTAQTGVCLKRASTARGRALRALSGCYAIARSIDCAIHRADYADNLGTSTDMEALARTIRAAGCQPCRVMPFEPLNPAECPDSALTGQPTTIDIGDSQQRNEAGIRTVQQAAFQNKADVDWGGRVADSGCQEVPPGRLTWNTPSFTGLAMANTRVRLEVQWDFANISRAPAQSTVRGLGQCFLTSLTRFGTTEPRFYFSVEVESLWPAGDPTDSSDTGDRYLIESLFGSDTLIWWDALSTAEQTGRTAAFYSTSAETIDVPCNREAPVWCVWEPQRAGYYSLTPTGALSMSLNAGISKNPAYAGSVPNDWHSQLSDETLRQCSNNPFIVPPNCQFSRGSSGEVGVYIDGEPIGVRVHEVRVISRATPS